MKDYQILLFYKYVHIGNPETVREWLLRLCKEYRLKGRLIVGGEGINCTVEGETFDTETFIKELETDERFLGIHYKRSVGTGAAFPKLSVKMRDEIVSGHLGVCDIDPNKVTGKRLSPEALHDWFIGNKEFYIVDMRNVYEHEVGKFIGSITPALENFRDLPKIIKSIAHLKHKTILTVCTGGVRCEKASGYLMQQGFADVWQLEGGIVSYMEKYPNEHFEGKLYVFDQRVTMGFYTDDPNHTVIGRCKQCRGKSEHFVNCSNVWCGAHFILCESCVQEQKRKQGSVTCVNTCNIRRPDKIHSFGILMKAKLKAIFS